MRRKEQPITVARDRASSVFPTPGTSSTSTWPRHSTATRSWSTTSIFPTTTVATAARIRSGTDPPSATDPTFTMSLDPLLTSPGTVSVPERR